MRFSDIKKEHPDRDYIIIEETSGGYRFREIYRDNPADDARDYYVRDYYIDDDFNSVVVYV